MTEKIQAIRGMNDILADQTGCWQYLEALIRRVLEQYGYQEIRFPILEKTELFAHSIGETTDIVSKEMYSFVDRNGENLTLRPEGTAGCVRAGLQHGLFQAGVQKLWYAGPMFRRERPQKGRLRQFHQTGVEAFGLPGPDIDAELILLCARLWRELGLRDITLQINSLGSAAARLAYRNVLVEYFTEHEEQLDEDSRARLLRNPLRILDSKNPDLQDLIARAPAMSRYLDPESADHFASLQELLTGAGVTFTVNPRLVRGLDYYCKTVFEWVTDRLGAQGTVCAGGRYDGMVEHFGGKATPAVGFALGMERLLELADLKEPPAESPDLYFIHSGAGSEAQAMQLAEQVRDVHPSLKVILHCGGGGVKSQFKKADRSGAMLALILAEDELARNTVAIKHLRRELPQREVAWSALPGALSELLMNV